MLKTCITQVVFYIILAALTIGLIFGNFMLYHNIVGAFCIMISFGLYTFSWYTRDLHQDDFLLFLGVLFLFVSIFDLLHIFSYGDSTLFPKFSIDLPFKFNLVARFLQSAAFLFAPFYLIRQFYFTRTFILLLLFTSLIITIILTIDALPVVFLEESGYTQFASLINFISSLMLGAALFFSYNIKDDFESPIFIAYFTAITLTLLSVIISLIFSGPEKDFMIIVDALRVLSFYCLYCAILVKALKKPYELVFRKLNQHHMNVESENDILVQEITKRKIVEKENQGLIKELQKTLSEVKRLQGIIPICSYCKKIRDDEGYWKQVEEYFHEHSDTSFSHGICPECVSKVFPELESD